MKTNFDNKYSVGSVEFNYSRFSRKWEFSFKGQSGSNNTVLLPAGGKDKAHKIASILNGAIKRNGAIDGLARSNINRLVFA